jgi:hypothetical protein
MVCCLTQGAVITFQQVEDSEEGSQKGEKSRSITQGINDAFSQRFRNSVIVTQRISSIEDVKRNCI